MTDPLANSINAHPLLARWILLVMFLLALVGADRLIEYLLKGA